MDQKVIQLLRFRVGPDVFALPIERVLQITNTRPVTRVPSVAACIAGVFNHEGAITPLVDLGTKFRVERDDTTRTCIVIVAAEHDGEIASIGLLADGVIDVVPVATPQIEPPPSFGIHVRLEYLAGITKIGGGFTLILNVDRFLNTAELLDLAVAREQVPA